ncbi:MAG: protein kinase [Phycisphaerales bacterium]|nr:protein kinase [Phycisphaerales bacterium]
MKQTAQCPSSELLKAFIAGGLPEAQVDSVSRHLDVCRECRRRVEADPAEAAFDDDLRYLTRAHDDVPVDMSVPLQRLNASLSDYEIISEIGRGGMGIVYKARQISLNRIVALKVLPALLGVVRPDAITRFRREAELAAHIQHTNIVGIYDMGEVDGTFYYAMQLIDGRSLQDLLAEIKTSGAVDVVFRVNDGTSSSPRPSSSSEKSGFTKPTRDYFRQVATWFADVADALHYAHSHGVIHRDIKPSNLLLNPDSRLIIADFGLAKPIESDPLTTSASLLGTAQYLSPEQVDTSIGLIDHRVDVYALGATLYELLAFRPLFASANDREVLNQILHRDPTPPHRFVDKVPRELETICMKAVEKDRRARYASAQELGDDLRRWLLDLPIHAKRPSRVTRAVRLIWRRKIVVSAFVTIFALILTVGLLLASNHHAQRHTEQIQSIADARGLKLLLHQAKADFHGGHFEAGLDKVESVLAQQKDVVEAQILRATFLGLLHRHDEHIHQLEDILRHDATNSCAHYFLSIANRNIDPDKSRYHQEKVAELDSNTGSASYLRGLVESDPHRAIAFLNRAIAADPSDVNALLERSERYKQIGDYERMLADADQAVGILPTLPYCYAKKGDALVQLRRFEDSLSAFTKVIQLDPNHAPWWLERAWAQLHLGRLAESRADVEQAIRLDPQSSYGYIGRAMVLMALGKIDEGLRECEQAIFLDPQDPLLHRKHGYMLGKYADRKEEAIAAYGRCLELDPNEIQALRNRGILHLRMGHDADAHADLTRALELSLDKTSAYHLRGSANITLQRFDEAINDLSRVLEYQPINYMAYLRRGMAYELTERIELALADYQRAALLDTGASDRAALWTYVLRSKNRKYTDALPYRQMARGGNAWTERTLDMLSGRISPDELVTAASSDIERCQAHYYAGRLALLKGRIREGASAMKRCVAMKQTAELETEFARALLRQLRDNKHSPNTMSKESLSGLRGRERETIQNDGPS